MGVCHCSVPCLSRLKGSVVVSPRSQLPASALSAMAAASANGRSSDEEPEVDAAVVAAGSRQAHRSQLLELASQDGHATSAGHTVPESGAGLGTAPSQAACSAPMVNEAARSVLKFSKGITRVPLEDLGPALFNRQGAATCGQHCHDLGTRILTMEGFATFRYVAGFCHEPDPEDLLAVARHGNTMAAADPLLPRLPMKPLKGVFAKTHLVTFLQLYNNGQMPALVAAQGKSRVNPAQASSQSMGSPTTANEFADVLEQGLFMHVFPWWVVRDHREAVLALMASDNFDHGHGLADSELRCINAVRAAIAASSQGRLPVPAGDTQYDVVQRHVLRMAGQKWREQDIGCFWNFAMTTLDQHMDIMQDVWSFAGCEAVLRVEAAFFGELAKVGSKLQWTRAALAIAHFLSDREKECSVVAGRCVAGAISKASLKKVRERDSESSLAWEEWSEAIMHKRWVPALVDPPPVPRVVVLKAAAGFLGRNGKCVVGSQLGDASAQQAKLETKLRQALEPEWSGLFPTPLAASCQEEKKTRQLAAGLGHRTCSASGRLGAAGSQCQACRRREEVEGWDASHSQAAQGQRGHWGHLGRRNHHTHLGGGSESDLERKSRERQNSGDSVGHRVGPGGTEAIAGLDPRSKARNLGHRVDQMGSVLHF